MAVSKKKPPFALKGLTTDKRSVIIMATYRQNASYDFISKKPWDPATAEVIDDEGGTTNKNALPFGLCKKFGISLPDGARPRDAWEALKQHGVYPPWTPEGEDQYTEDGLKEGAEEAKGEEAKETEEPNVEEVKKILGEKHSKNIADLLRQKPEHTKIFNYYAKKLRIVDENDGSGHYWSWGGGIYFNITNDSAPVSEFKGYPYQTYFHETAHNIDNVSSNIGVLGYTTAKFHSEKYKKTISYTMNGVTQEQTIGYTLSDMIQEEAKAYIEARKKERKARRATQVYGLIRAEISQYRYADSGAVSDMFAGVTKHGIKGHGYHKKSYFDDKSNYGIEFFAEVFAAEIVSPVGVEATKKYFPKSYEIYQEIKSSIIKEIDNAKSKK